MNNLRKCLALLLTLALLPGLALGGAPEILTVEELLIWREGVFAALDPQTQPEVSLEDVHAYATDFGSVEASVASLVGQTPEVLHHIELSNDQLAGPRNLQVGDTLEALLSAYPGSDVDLIPGTTQLYAQEENGLFWGLATVEGGDIIDVRFAAAQPDPDKPGFWQEVGIIYSLADGKITGIRVYGLGDWIDEAEARANYDSIQTSAAWNGEITPFGPEDLIFNGLTLLGCTPSDIKDFLGDPLVDEFIESEGLRVLGYTDMLFELTIGPENAITFNALMVTAPTVPGPRDILVGDSLETVLARFPQEGSGNQLYGGENPPFGLITEEEDGSITLRYCFQMEGEDTRQAMLHLSFRNDLLSEYLLYAFTPEE